MLNGTYICTHTINKNVMIKGKEYTFADGRFIREDGDTSNYSYCTIEHFNTQNYAKIKEITK